MLIGIRDKVTDLIFRVRVEGKDVSAKSAYQVTTTQHQTSDAYGVGDNVRETAALIAEPSAEAPPAQQPSGEVRTIVPRRAEGGAE